MTEERNKAIAALAHMGVTRAQIAAAYGITTARIAQIIAKQMRREARSLGVPLSVLENHHKPRAKGKEGTGYSAAATIEQREALRVWEAQAREVYRASAEMERYGLTDFAARVRVNGEKNHDARREFKADCFADEIVAIKRHYDTMSEAERAEMKEPLAAQIDELLGHIRRESRRVDSNVLSMARHRAKRRAA